MEAFVKWHFLILILPMSCNTPLPISLTAYNYVPVFLPIDVALCNVTFVLMRKTCNRLSQ